MRKASLQPSTFFHNAANILSRHVLFRSRNKTASSFPSFAVVLFFFLFFSFLFFFFFLILVPSKRKLEWKKEQTEKEVKCEEKEQTKDIENKEKEKLEEKQEGKEELEPDFGGLTEAENREKEMLLEKGFANWNKRDYITFVKVSFRLQS
jgi:flagellar biosynthesis/type III secretory pathway M-ring protein FliF/YscJ